MSIFFKLYLFTRLDTIHGISIGALVIIVILGFGVLINCLIEHSFDEDIWSKSKWYLKVLKYGIPLPLLIFLLVPSKEDAILIYAGGSAIEYVKSDSSLQKIPIASTEYILKLIEEKTEELKK